MGLCELQGTTKADRSGYHGIFNIKLLLSESTNWLVKEVRTLIDWLFIRSNMS